REQPDRRHGRQDPDRSSQAGGLRSGPDRADPAGDRRHRVLLSHRARRGATPDRSRDHSGLRGGSERLMIDLARLRLPSGQSSLLAWAMYHALRWAPVIVLAALAFWVFPSPTHLTAPLLRVGETATESIVAPFYFVVPKSDAERAL